MTKVAIPVAIVIGLAAAWWMSRSRPAPAPEVATIATHPSAAERTATSSGPQPSLGSAAESAGGQQGPPPHARDPRPLVRDPRKPGYDAGRLYELRLNDAVGIFQAEPRDAAWAKARETDIAAAALDAFKGVDPDVRMEVECHTGVCRVRVFSKNGYLNKQMAPYPLMCLASSAEPEWADPQAADPFADFYLVFNESMRGDDGFRAQRDTTCAKYRDGWKQQAPRR